MGEDGIVDGDSGRPAFLDGETQVFGHPTGPTTYLGDALDALRADGYNVTDEAAAHLTPAQHDHINFYGTYSFDVETELQRKGHRPRRSPAA